MLLPAAAAALILASMLKKPLVRGYLRRYVVWTVSAAVALPVYGLAELTSLSQLLVLAVTFAAAAGGAVLGKQLTRRLGLEMPQDAGPAPAAAAPQRPPPRARGSGRRAR